jgi:glutamate synthase (NADPH/NADH) small chain
MEKLKIAIVGAGPAGLAAAKELLSAGCLVDIYEKEAFAGGVMAFGIPSFRIKMEAVSRSVDPVIALGGNFKFNQDLKESDFIRLSKEYDYVYLAFGLTKVRHLGIKGDDLKNSLNALEFLREYNFSEKIKDGSSEPKLHGTVVVVGAGNVAMDASRVATRCGAERTLLVYRRSKEEAPCTKVEMDQAIADGVECIWLSNPVEVLGENGVVKGVKVETMALGEEDSSGRRKPVGTGEYKVIDCDYIISAIGQIPDMSIYDTKEILEDHGYLKADTINYQTNIKNIYTGGDILLGAKTIGAALKCGKDFAKIIIEKMKEE